MKKYKLVIPNEMKRWIRSDLLKRDGEILDCWHEHLHELGWIEEVKYPVTADEYLKGAYPVKQYADKSFWQVEDIEIAFKAGEENQKLRHVGTKTCNESWAEYKKYWNIAGSFMADRRYKSGWEACKKSHGLDCD